MVELKTEKQIIDDINNCFSYLHDFNEFEASYHPMKFDMLPLDGILKGHIIFKQKTTLKKLKENKLRDIKFKELDDTKFFITKNVKDEIQMHSTIKEKVDYDVKELFKEDNALEEIYMVKTDEFCDGFLTILFLGKHKGYYLRLV